MKTTIIRFVGILLLFGSCKIPTTEIRLNDMQVIGSHNSYKIPIEESLWKYIYSVDSIQALALQYGHVPIADQLQLGLRNLELDVFYDPRGDHYSNPKGLDIVRQSGTEPLEYDWEEKLKEPGFKLFHIQDIDFRSYHLLFKDCLNEMKAWSHDNPDHTPVVVLMNAKDQSIEGTREPLPFTQEAFDGLDREIRSVFSDDDLITPDWVRGDSKTLEEVVLRSGWPVLTACKGRFLFVLDENEAKTNLYLNGHETLEDRVFFVNVPEGNPASAFRVINNPIDNYHKIKELVGKGYMVRTRADAGTVEARNNDYSRFLKAIDSGAQVISTDYYIPSTLFKSSFQVIFEDGTYERIKE